MTFKEAMDRVLSGHKDCKVTTVLEFLDKFVVSIQPKNWNPEEILLDPFFAVDKKSGKVSEWSPIMDPEGFKKAFKEGLVYKEGDKIEEEPPKEIAHYMDYTPDDLMHYGVKGMKWRQHKSRNGMDNAAVTGMGGAPVEIDLAEQDIREQEEVSQRADRLADAMSRRAKKSDKASIFHMLNVRSKSADAKQRAERGKRKVQQIKEYAKKMSSSFEHSDVSEEMTSVMECTPSDLMHFGIKGMKWGIRRFQPYQKGERVKGGKEIGAATKVKQRPSSGNIIERYKAHKTKQKRSAALKKAQATRKANADFEAEKKKAIESGTVEDLAKFKGKLTNEEYNRAFMRLQNEQKVAALVQANQKTVWDKVDKGMEIVARVSKYANVVTTAKNNFDAMDEALHKKERDAEKERKTAEKNKFLTNIDNITELNEGVEKHKITPQEYQAAMNILANKKMNRARFTSMGEGGDFEDQNKKAAKEQAARDQADRDKWTAEQNWKQYQKRQEKEAKRKEKEAKGRPMDGTWREDNPSSNSGSNANSNSNSSSSQTTAKAATPNMNASRPTEKSAESGKKIVDKYAARMANVRATYSNDGAAKAYSDTKAKFAKQRAEQDAKDRAMIERIVNKNRQTEATDYGKRSISGAKTAGSNTTYKQQTNLDFGGSKVSKFSAKPSTPSKVVTDTRKTVANTQAERARQKEVDKKRKAKIK